MFLCVAVVLAALFGGVAMVRLLDGDEGFYLYAARLAVGDLPFFPATTGVETRALYRDFFYPQAPLMPYIYGTWSVIVGEGFVRARLLSALLAVAQGLLLYSYVTQTTGRRGAGALAALLFALTGLHFAWYTVVKTYALSGFLLFAAFYLLEFPKRLPANLRLFASGLLLALAAGTRLFYLAPLPIFLWAAFRPGEGDGPGGGARVAGALILLAGFAIGLAPNVPFYLASPENFIFGNWGYHEIRIGSGGIFESPREKVKVLLSVLGIWETRGAEGFQFSILAFVNLVLLFSFRKLKTHLPVAFWIAAVFCLASALPSPAYFQYFTMATPFLIVGAMHLAEAARKVEGNASGVLERAGSLLAIAYLAVAPLDIYRYVAWGKDVPGAMESERAEDWTLETAAEIARQVQVRTRPGEEVLTWWPGHLIGTQAGVVPGMENHFAQEIDHKLTAEERERYGIVTSGEIAGWIENGRTRVVVLGRWVGGWRGPERGFYRDLLVESGYRVAYKVGDTEIFEIPERAVAESSIRP